VSAGAPIVRLRPLSLADVDHMMPWVNDPTVVGKLARCG
jgi:hypothetical protein